MRKTPREVCRHKKELFVLTALQQSVLIGTILGDAGIRYRGNECRLHIKHSARQLDLVRFKRQIFDSITSMSERVFVQQVQLKNYSFAEFVTLTHPIFTKYYHIFYRDNRKIIPDNIGTLLTNPLSLAVLIMDDGSAEYAGLSIQTHSFSKKEVILLATAINDNFGLKTTIRLNKGKWIIYFPKANMEKLKSLVGKYILPSFRYKFSPYCVRHNPVETIRRTPHNEGYDIVRSLR